MPIHSDLGAQEEGGLSLVSTFSPSVCHVVRGLRAMILVFFKICRLEPALSLSTLTLVKRLKEFLFTFCLSSGVNRVSEVVVPLACLGLREAVRFLPV